MFLESLSDPNRINIKDLGLERPEPIPKELPFDPRRDLTVDDFDKLKEGIDAFGEYDYMDSEEWQSFAQIAAALTILFPDKAKKFNFNTKTTQDGIKKELLELINNDVKSTNESVAFGDLAFCSQIIAPGLVNSILNFEAEDRLTEELSIQYSLAYWTSYSSLAPAYQSIYPNNVNELAADERSWLGLNKCTEDCRQLDMVYGFASGILALKLLFPERSDEVDLILDQDAWDRMFLVLERNRNGDTLVFLKDFAGLAMKMALLAADKVVLTQNKGIQIWPPFAEPDFNEPDLDLPIRRNF